MEMYFTSLPIIVFRESLCLSLTETKSVKHQLFMYFNTKIVESQYQILIIAKLYHNENYCTLFAINEYVQNNTALSIMLSVSQRRSFLRNKKPSHIGSFKRQQLLLSSDSAAIPRKATVCTHDTMARNHKGNRIMPDSTADCLRRHFHNFILLRNLYGNFYLCHGFSVWNCQHDIAYRFSERR